MHPITALQIEYSLFSRDIEAEILPLCRELGIAVVAYSPVGRGLITGSVAAASELSESDVRRNQPRFADANLGHNLALVAQIRDIAAETGCTPAQAAIAWVMAQGQDLTPIPGTRKVVNLEENVAAADVVLTPAQLNALTGLAPAAGSRSSATAMAMMGH